MRPINERMKKRVNYSKLLGKARIANIDLLKEKCEIKAAMNKYKVYESIFTGERRAGYSSERMILPMTKNDKAENRARKIWNSFPLHAFHYWTVNPKSRLKNYLKKLERIILDYEAVSGQLPNPHRNAEVTLIPFLWRLNLIGELDEHVHAKLTRMHDVQYNNGRFKLNTKVSFLSIFPEPPCDGSGGRRRQGGNPGVKKLPNPAASTAGRQRLL